MSETPIPPAWLQREGVAPVPVAANCALGRAVANDVVLVDDRVSRRHATIHVQGEREFWLVDLGSRNGTYLNGRRVSQPTRLREGDLVQIGPFNLTFRIAAAPETAPSPLYAADQTQMDLRSLSCWLLVCDIVGSAGLARDQSPGELAELIGGWIARCKDLIEDSGGTINKYLGDGLLAYWNATDPARPLVAQALRDLRRLQDERRPVFRVVLHHGQVFAGGMPSQGEESLSGPEVNFVFRQEKLAGRLRLDRLASSPAAARLGDLHSCQPVGEHEVPDYPGRHPFFTF